MMIDLKEVGIVEKYNKKDKLNVLYNNPFTTLLTATIVTKGRIIYVNKYE